MSVLSSGLLAGLLFALVAPEAAAADAAWRVVRGEVRVVCPMTVGGSFEAKTGALAGTVTLDPATLVFGGELSVDLRSLDTGIGLRNEHMQNNYLEVGRGPGFDRALLSEIRLGEGDPRGIHGKARFTGTLLVHGTKRPVSGEASVQRTGRTVHVDARFPVVIPEFGIDKPRYLGVGVTDQVNVVVSLVAEPADGAEAAK